MGTGLNDWLDVVLEGDVGGEQPAELSRIRLMPGKMIEVSGAGERDLLEIRSLVSSDRKNCLEPVEHSHSDTKDH